MAKAFEKNNLILLVLLVLVTAALVIDVMMTHRIILDTTILLHQKDMQFEQRLNRLELGK